VFAVSGLHTFEFDRHEAAFDRNEPGSTARLFPPVYASLPVPCPCLSRLTDFSAPIRERRAWRKDMKNIGLNDNDPAAPEVDSGLLTGWLDRTDLARELTLSVDTLQRWETRRMGPPCVRVGRKVLYRMEAVRDWLREQEARKAGVSRAVAGRR
jgi:hypothetical protein